MTDAPLLFVRAGGITLLTLNRPQAGNAIDVPTARVLMHAAIDCDEDAAMRCRVSPKVAKGCARALAQRSYQPARTLTHRMSILGHCEERLRRSNPGSPRDFAGLPLLDCFGQAASQ
jgi:hypothetical protein